MGVRAAIVAQLGSFYGDHRIHVGDDFACPHRSKCEAFAQPRALVKGIEAHVGSFYGEGRRIVVVSLDSGASSEALEDRTHTIEPITPKTAGNAHMYGTTIFVQQLVNAEAPPERPMAHVAMLNSAKCGGDDGTMNTVPFPVHCQCREYLFAEIRILRPDLVWLQGRIVRDVISEHLTTFDPKEIVSTWLTSMSPKSERLASLVAPIAQEYFRLMSDGERQMVAILTPHPSDRYGRWGLFQRSVMPLVADLAAVLTHGRPTKDS
jgi:hypothetical protein